jgi:hypothetical protein
MPSVSVASIALPLADANSASLFIRLFAFSRHLEKIRVRPNGVKRIELITSLTTAKAYNYISLSLSQTTHVSHCNYAPSSRILNTTTLNFEWWKQL